MYLGYEVTNTKRLYLTRAELKVIKSDQLELERSATVGYREVRLFQRTRPSPLDLPKSRLALISDVLF
jgi:hypothetical protein